MQLFSYIPSRNGFDTQYISETVRHLGVIHDDSNLSKQKDERRGKITLPSQTPMVLVTDIYLLIFWQRSGAMHLHLLVNIAYAYSLNPWSCLELFIDIHGFGSPCLNKTPAKMLRLVKIQLHYTNASHHVQFETRLRHTQNSVHARLLLLWLLGLRNNFHLTKLHRF